MKKTNNVNDVNKGKKRYVPFEKMDETNEYLVTQKIKTLLKLASYDIGFSVNLTSISIDILSPYSFMGYSKYEILEVMIKELLLDYPQFARQINTIKDLVYNDLKYIYVWFS